MESRGGWKYFVGAVASSSLFIVGDSHEIHLASLFDTPPPESYIVGLDITTPEQNRESYDELPND
ncbi:hypothetical protein JCM21714_2718 [Gracilibacillus boraciitolerans JCM 21714]|uniref:Uncharacterized protein n=1 Tax=Gracilibacillus boraciitolerans JCM 21714 TaxID=1298598 RepID=W4VLH0_9BACI|nr:hypothetical protein JCM21714_2718 [Gracilibacillus boraciitolerans JCM 21714]